MAHRVFVIAGDNEILRTLPPNVGDTIETRQLASANEALWEVNSDSPMAILTNLDLGDEMSGLDLAGIIPSFDLPTKIILWSQAEDDSIRQQAAEAGVYLCLQGPVTSEELQEQIMAAVTAAVNTPRPEPEPEPEPPPKEEPKPRGEHKSALRSRLSSRTLATKSRENPPPKRPESRPLPPAEPAADSGFGRRRRETGTLILTAENLNLIRNVMSQLSQELGPQCVLLTDRAGMVLVEVGSVDRLPTMILLPLLSTGFSTTGEVARQLGEAEGTALFIHEGTNYDLYCFDILQRFLLVLVFNKKVASSKIGAVWVNTKRAIRELQEPLT